MRLLLLALVGWPLLVRADWWWPATNARDLAQRCEQLATRLAEAPPTVQGPAIADAQSAIAQGQWLTLNHHQTQWRQAGADCELQLTLALTTLDSRLASDRSHPLVAARGASAPTNSAVESARSDLNSAVSAYARQLSSANQQPLLLPDECPPVTSASLAEYLDHALPASCRNLARQRWQQRASHLGGGTYTALIYARQQLAEAEGEPSWRHWRARDALLSPLDVDRLLIGIGRRNCPQPEAERPPLAAETVIADQLTLLEQRLGLTMSQQPLTEPAFSALPLIALQLQWRGDQPGPRWLLLDLFARPGKAVKRVQAMPIAWNEQGQILAVAVSAGLPPAQWSAPQQRQLIEGLANALMVHRSPQASDLKGLWGALAQRWWQPLQPLQLGPEQAVAAALVARSHRLPLARDGGAALISNSLRTLQLAEGAVVAAQLWASPGMISDDALAYRPLWLALLAGQLTALPEERLAPLLTALGGATEQKTLLEVMAVPNPQAALNQLLAGASCTGG
ncbi:MAG: hypothetical protein II007_12440 [Gammaproteobacteria bacterium]|nr:hypothetical protein [Gammaproteobacteria bacterium]